MFFRINTFPSNPHIPNAVPKHILLQMRYYDTQRNGNNYQKYPCSWCSYDHPMCIQPGCRKYASCNPRSAMPHLPNNSAQDKSMDTRGGEPSLQNAGWLSESWANGCSTQNTSQITTTLYYKMASPGKVLVQKNILLQNGILGKGFKQKLSLL